MGIAAWNQYNTYFTACKEYKIVHMKSQFCVF